MVQFLYCIWCDTVGDRTHYLPLTGANALTTEPPLQCCEFNTTCIISLNKPVEKKIGVYYTPLETLLSSMEYFAIFFVIL